MARELVEVDEDNVLKLCNKVLSKIGSDEYAPDFILCVLRGGLIPGEVISDNMCRRLEFVRIKSYDNRVKSDVRGLNERLGNVKGKKILVVDDILDSGDTLEYLKEYLYKAKGAEDVRTAVLLSKETKSADYYGGMVSKEPWYHFYWEKD